MSDETGISWTESTWNPWMGCTKVSDGCDHCYMFREQRQYGHDPEIVRHSKTKFTAPLKMDGSRLIFTCSWSDWFGNYPFEGEGYGQGGEPF
jgi:protein gp37